MNRNVYRDEIKLALTGGVLELEIDDATIDKVVDSAFRESQRYIDITKFETLPYEKCIDLSPRHIENVNAIYRADAYSGTTSTGMADPMYATQWQVLSANGNVLNQNYLMNYASWNTTQQIRNTLATDLSFIYDKNTNKLYVSVSTGTPEKITIEYIPRYDDVSEVDNDFWIDVITRLSIAKTKIVLGRIRTRYTQSGALWTMDGDTLLNEGNTELTTLRDYLRTNAHPIMGLD